MFESVSFFFAYTYKNTYIREGIVLDLYVSHVKIDKVSVKFSATSIAVCQLIWLSLGQ